MAAHEEAAPPGGLLVWGAPVLVVDSITEAMGPGAGCVVVSGSHGGLSAGRFALQAGVRLAVFNDAGVGKDGAGTAALALLQAQGVAACTVAHDGVISHANRGARALGARPGLRLKDWLISAA
jgi:hypothetical protein